MGQNDRSFQGPPSLPLACHRRSMFSGQQALAWMLLLASLFMWTSFGRFFYIDNGLGLKPLAVPFPGAMYVEPLSF